MTINCKTKQNLFWLHDMIVRHYLYSFALFHSSTHLSFYGFQWTAIRVVTHNGWNCQIWIQTSSVLIYIIFVCTESNPSSHHKWACLNSNGRWWIAINITSYNGENQQFRHPTRPTSVKQNICTIPPIWSTHHRYYGF